MNAYSSEAQKSVINEMFAYFVRAGAEWNYAVGVPLNYVASFSKAIPKPASLGISLGWNYLDAIYCIAQGMEQLCDETDYRQTENKIKGVANILSGVQMFLLSYNPALTCVLGLSGGAALIAPSFALSMGFDLVTAVIDYQHAQKEVTFEGWKKEREKEINFYQSKIKKLEKINSQDKKIDLLKKKKEKVEGQINLRASFQNNNLTSLETEIKRIENMWDKNEDDRKKLENLKQEKCIHEKLHENYQKQRTNLFVKTASFVGMTCLAVASCVSCPPLLMAGLAITVMVAAFYIYKNSDEIVATAKNGLQKAGFFSLSSSRTNTFGSSYSLPYPFQEASGVPVFSPSLSP